MASDTSRKVLVVYYSRTGNTARVARDLALRMHADIESLRDPDHGPGFRGSLMATVDVFRDKPANLGELAFDPRNYALTIVGTPVWAGRMTPAVRTYLRRFADGLGHVALFVTSANTRASKIVQPVERILGRPTDAFIGFAAADLADPQLYDQTLSSFVKALDSAAMPLPQAMAAAR